MSALDNLFQSDVFHLGGSRRMAEKYPELIKVSKDTDYDFYCADTFENRGFLAANGLELIECHSRNYWDSLLVDMYKHKSENIEVLIRSDVDCYQQAFESISGETYRYRLWKSCPLITIENMPAFRASVCAYFCELFRQFRKEEEFDNSDDIAF